MVRLGALAVVLVAARYKPFELDRFFVPKELVLHATAVVAALLCLSGVRRLSLSLAETFLAGYLAFGVISAVAATNWWLAARAIGVSLSGAALFWVARALARAGLSRPLVGGLALGVVVGAITALMQAYGVESDYFSLNRAPGGTFGNRNFVAHLAALGVPWLIYCALEARGAVAALGVVGMAPVAAMLVLSRSRAAWLALVACGVVFAAAGVLGLARWRDERRVRRLVLLGGAALVGSVAALTLPNTLDWKSESPYLDSVRGVVNYHEGSGKGRLAQYRTTADMALAHPVLGVGPGNWPVTYPRFAARNDPSLSGETGMTSNPWPSSDWAAFVSERGLPAFALLGLTFLGLAVVAIREMTRARDERYVAAMTLLGTLAVTAVVGAFDAVLLLPIPALFVWTALGALAPLERRPAVVLAEDAKRWVTIAVGVVGVLLVARSALQVQAMSIYSVAGRVASIERASRFDPSSYRIHMRLAELYARRGQCAGVRDHAGDAHDLFPNAPQPRRMLAACGVRQRGR